MIKSVTILNVAKRNGDGHDDTRLIVVPTEVRDQLALVLRSKTFQRASRLRSLLEYVVDGALHGQAGGQSQTARELLGKSEDFDPSLDPVVRVQFGRLRKALARYYAGEGEGDPLIIEIPDRQYTPVFQTIEPSTTRREEQAALPHTNDQPGGQ
jgi:hypothetical protein